MAIIKIDKILSLTNEVFHQKTTEYFENTPYTVDYAKGMIGQPVVCVNKNKFVGVWVKITERNGKTTFAMAPFIPSVTYRLLSVLILTLPAMIYAHLASGELRKQIEQFIKDEYQK